MNLYTYIKAQQDVPPPNDPHWSDPGDQESHWEANERGVSSGRNLSLVESRIVEQITFFEQEENPADEEHHGI